MTQLGYLGPPPLSEHMQIVGNNQGVYHKTTITSNNNFNSILLTFSTRLYGSDSDRTYEISIVLGISYDSTNVLASLTIRSDAEQQEQLVNRSLYYQTNNFSLVFL